MIHLPGTSSRPRSVVALHLLLHWRHVMFRPNAKHASDRRRRRSTGVHDDLDFEGIVNLTPIKNLTTIINYKGNSKIVRDGKLKTQISLPFFGSWRYHTNVPWDQIWPRRAKGIYLEVRHHRESRLYIFFTRTKSLLALVSNTGGITKVGTETQPIMSRIGTSKPRVLCTSRSTTLYVF